MKKIKYVVKHDNGFIKTATQSIESNFTFRNYLKNQVINNKLLT